MMGSMVKKLAKKKEKDKLAIERPRHKVLMTRGFYLGIHEVTQKQFEAVMGYNPSYFSRDGKKKPGVTYRDDPTGGKSQLGAKDDPDNYPVDNISWVEANEFCEKLSAMKKEEDSSRIYRLPTEAEWEYACRGGDSSYKKFHFGDELTAKQANFSESKLERTCEVGSYAANAFGLYDLHGNVWEWCGDWFAERYYADSPLENPRGPKEGSYRVLRGGSWVTPAGACRSAARGWGEPTRRDNFFGFRVALVPPSE